MYPPPGFGKFKIELIILDFEEIVNEEADIYGSANNVSIGI